MIEHPTIHMRSKPAWVAATMIGGVAVLASGLAMSSPIAALGVVWMAWGLSTLADQIRVEGMILHRRSFFGTPPPVDLGALTRVALTRWTGSRHPLPPLTLVLETDGGRPLDVVLRKWTNSKELMRLVAKVAVDATEHESPEPHRSIEMSERTIRRLREFL